MWNSIGVSILSIRVSRVDDRAVLELAGDLDLAAVADLRNQARTALETENCGRLSLDLGAVDFLDSSGLGVLVELRNLARDKDVPLEMINVPAGPARIITIAGLAETFGLVPDGNTAG